MANPKRYLQTGTAPSPQTGGATQLATLTAPVAVSGATAPVAGQVLQASSPTNALWATPASSGVVDDPVIQTVNFTAARNTRYTLSSALFPITVSLPNSGLVNGDIVEFLGTGVSAGFVTINGNGTTFFPSPYLVQGGPHSTMNYRVRELALSFRWDGSNWYAIGGSLTSFSSGIVPHTMPVTESSGSASRIALSNGDSVPGRVGGVAIQELRPWNVARNLYEDSGLNEINFDVGSLAPWLATVAFMRASSVQWLGAADLIVRGLYSSIASTDFRQDKVVLNHTGPNGTNGFKNIIWKHEDTGVADPYRVRHTAAAPSTDFADYVQGPGETVVLRYNGAIQRWFITPMAPSGRIDRRVQTTSVTPTIIHAYTTQTNSRVISYKVQVQARKTVGTTVGDSALFDITVLCERSSAGTVVVKDVVFINGPYKDAGAAAWDVTFTISGSDIRMNVVGDAVDTIQWRVTGNITEHG